MNDTERSLLAHSVYSAFPVSIHSTSCCPTVSVEYFRSGSIRPVSFSSTGSALLVLGVHSLAWERHARPFLWLLVCKIWQSSPFSLNSPALCVCVCVCLCLPACSQHAASSTCLCHAEQNTHTARQECAEEANFCHVVFCGLASPRRKFEGIV